MAWGDDFAIDRAPALVVAVLLVAFAVWIFVLDFRSRLHQALALVAVLRGVRFFFFFASHRLDSVWQWMMWYAELALPFAALFLAWAFARKYGLAGAWVRGGLGRSVPWVLLGAAVVLEVLYFFDHGLVFDLGPPARAGPLSWIDNLAAVVMLGTAHLFLFAARNALIPGARTGLMLAALGFALEPFFRNLFFSIAYIPANGDLLALLAASPTGLASYVLFVIGVVLGALLAWRYPRISRGGTGAVRTRGAWAVLWMGVAAATAAGMGAWNELGGSMLFINLLRALDAAWALALPGLLGYAILQHHLFDLQVKVRFVVKQGTLAAAFVSTFFIVSEGVQTLVERFSEGSAWGPWGPMAGVVAAGVFVFATHPLHRFAERVSQRAAPAKPISEMTRDDRVKLYREQAELAWLDGMITRKERLLLDRLAERLGIAGAAASAIESDVVRAVPGVGPAPRRKPRATSP